MKYGVFVFLIVTLMSSCNNCARELIYHDVYKARTASYGEAIIDFPSIDDLNIVYYEDSIVVDDSVIYTYPWGKELLKFRCVYECKFGRLDILALYFEGEWLEVYH